VADQALGLSRFLPLFSFSSVNQERHHNCLSPWHRSGISGTYSRSRCFPAFWAPQGAACSEWRRWAQAYAAGLCDWPGQVAQPGCTRCVRCMVSVDSFSLSYAAFSVGTRGWLEWRDGQLIGGGYSQRRAASKGCVCVGCRSTTAWQRGPQGFWRGSEMLPRVTGCGGLWAAPGCSRLFA